MSFTWNAFSPLLIAIDLGVLACIAVCMAVLLRRAGGFPARTTPEAWRALRMGGLLGILPWLAAGLAVGGIIGLSLIARVLWAAATLGVPLVGVVLLRRWGQRRLWALVLVPLALKLYGEVLEPNWLDVETLRVPVAGLRAPIRIAHLSDLQTDGIGRIQLAARAAANAFDPDLVLFTGDVMNHPSLYAEVTGYLAGYHGRAGKFFVSGNVDGFLDFPRFCADSGFDCLDGRAPVLDLGGARVGVLGLGIHDFADFRLLGRLVFESRSADVRLLLSHVPDALAIAQGAPVAMLFAGHTHGGQVALPFFGPVVTMSGVPRAIAAGGLHRVADLRVLVSRGLGWEGHIAPRVRTFSRPHMVLVELVPLP